MNSSKNYQAILSLSVHWENQPWPSSSINYNITLLCIDWTHRLYDRLKGPNIPCVMTAQSSAPEAKQTGGLLHWKLKNVHLKDITLTQVML